MQCDAENINIISCDCYTSNTKGLKKHVEAMMGRASLAVQNSSFHLNPGYRCFCAQWTWVCMKNSLISAILTSTAALQYIPYNSFWADGLNPFVTETEECHINLLLHYDNCVLCRTQCSYIKPIACP